MNKQNLDLRLKQSLSLTPQLQQAIKILNMNSLEVELEISQMMAQNFMLEPNTEYSLESLQGDGDIEAEQPIDSIDYDDWEEEFATDWSELQPQQNAENNLDNYVFTEPTLAALLIEQIEQMPISDELADAARIITYCLDDDGYFRDDLASIAKTYQLPKALLEKALTIVRSCQPSGVGAIDLEDCLNIQIELLPDETPYLDTLKLIMQRHFYFIGKDPALIRNRLKLNNEQYEHAIALLRSLNPTPGFRYNEAQAHYIKPDIIVNERHGISYIETSDNLETKLTINQSYATLVAQATGKDKTLLSAQLQEAKWFINTLEKRANTIKQVAGIVIAYQQDFFQQGELAMRPLTRQQVAEMLELHESTVSRAVNGKYLLCKRGLYELRYFFSNHLENSIGEDQSITAIKAMIAKLIEQEDKKKPLSDDKISQLLAKDGHQIARRTVSKYREAINIPPSSVRRSK